MPNSSSGQREESDRKSSCHSGRPKPEKVSFELDTREKTRGSKAKQVKEWTKRRIPTVGLGEEDGDYKGSSPRSV